MLDDTPCTRRHATGQHGVHRLEGSARVHCRPEGCRDCAARGRAAGSTGDSPHTPLLPAGIFILVWGATTDRPLFSSSDDLEQNGEQTAEKKRRASQSQLEQSEAERTRHLSTSEDQQATIDAMTVELAEATSKLGTTSSELTALREVNLPPRPRCTSPAHSPSNHRKVVVDELTTSCTNLTPQNATAIRQRNLRVDVCKERAGACDQAVQGGGGYAALSDR